MLASLAIAFAWLSSKLLLVIHLSVPWWIDAPSVMAFYGVLYALFDRYLWRIGLVSKLGLVRMPILAGRWYGYLISSFDGHAKHHDLMITICQSWTQIAVFLTTAKSISRSCAAEFKLTIRKVFHRFTSIRTNQWQTRRKRCTCITAQRC